MLFSHNQILFTEKSHKKQIPLLTGAIYGLERIGPIRGIDLRNDTITPKKSPNRARIPKHSIANPIIEYLSKINTIPAKKQRDPRALLGRAKK